MTADRTFLHEGQLQVRPCEHSVSSNSRAGFPHGDLLFSILSDHSVNIVALRSLNLKPYLMLQEGLP